MVNQCREEFLTFWCDEEKSLESREILMKEIDIQKSNICVDFKDLEQKIKDSNWIKMKR